MAKNTPDDPKDKLTVSSALIAPQADRSLNPTQTAILWHVASELDALRVQPDVKNSVWLDLRAADLRGPGPRRPDNLWLKECLARLNETTIRGEYRGQPWGAVVVAEWHITDGGQRVRVLVPPAAVRAIRTPDTFAQIELSALHHLSGYARRLYALLADRKRQARPSWRWPLEDLHHALGTDKLKAYREWKDFRRRVLEPAVEEINKFGTVTVKMYPQKTGRWVTAVRFEWRWKTVDEARVTGEELVRPEPYAPAPPPAPDAPPLIRETRAMRRKNAAAWWDRLPSAARADYRERLAPLDPPIVGPGGRVLASENPEWRVQLDAWEEAHPAEPRFDDLPED